MARQHAIGIDLGGTNLRAGLVDDRGTILHRAHVPTDSARGPEAIAADIAMLIAACAEHGEPMGVGIGCPGFLELPAGIVAQSPNLPGWEGYHFKEAMEQLQPYPVFLDNDANAAAMGEHTFGVAHDADNFCHLTLGTGVGGGVFLNGSLYRGAHGMAGEPGHLQIDPQGIRCECGNTGCLETIVSANGFRNHISRLGKEMSVADGADLARNGNKELVSVFETMGTALGVGAAIITNLLDIQLISIGGGVARAWDLMEGPTRASFQERAIGPLRSLVRIKASTLDDDAAVLGASSLVFAP